MNVLVACEESQAVCKEFRKHGHNAFSCDLIPCSGGFPQWHIQCSVLNILNGFCTFLTADGVLHSDVLKSPWDLVIAHPPCTYLTNAGNAYLNLPGRSELRLQAFTFFLNFVNCNAPHVVIENPPGYINSHFRPADQTVHPFFFCSPDDSLNFHYKRTCLWLFNVPPLQYKEPSVFPSPISVTLRSDGTKKNRYFTESASSAFVRSKTFPALAAAMAAQWSEFYFQPTLF